jgi:hypothetical protein
MIIQPTSSEPTKKVIELKIQLDGIKPSIHRTFQVEATTTLTRLHKMLQKIMGWEDYHLFSFQASAEFSGSIAPEALKAVVFPSPTKRNGNNRQLQDFLFIKNQKFYYTYDMGDCWEHTLTVKKIIEVPADSTVKYPIALKGARACPPEDCGGIWGYQHLLELMQTPEHPDYEEQVVEWLGEDFDSEAFSVEETNIKLHTPKPRARNYYRSAD